MLLPAFPEQTYFATNGSVATAFGGYRGTRVDSNASANTYGTWTQIHAGLTYPSDYVLVRVGAVRTSGDIISATTLNYYIDIGIGPDSSNVTTIVEKLGGSNADSGFFYFIPLRIPPDTPVWARHQNTQGSARAGVTLTVFGGSRNPSAFPSVSQVVALGATTASTTGTSISLGASGSEGGWTAIVASTSEDYVGTMLSGIFAVDTALTSNALRIYDAGVGGSGSERLLGDAVAYDVLYSTAEQRIGFTWPIMCDIPAGSRLCARGSCDQANDSTQSIMMYGFVR